MASQGIDVIEITGGQRDRLLALEEGHYNELKATQISTKKLGQTAHSLRVRT